MENKLILITNNRYQDPFLHSQLINIYEDFEFDSVFLLCGTNDAPKNVLSKINLVDNLIDKKSGLYRFFKFYLVIYKLLKTNSKDNLVIHLRGFVGAFIYFFIPKKYKKNSNYIYDPRGAFIYGKQETNPRFRKTINLLRIIEKKIIKNSFFTIVESKQLKEQMIELYGYNEKYTICYNASSFKSESTVEINKKSSLNICYCGSVNHWHDINEIKRIFTYLNTLFPDKKINNYIFTQKRNHNLVEETFLNFNYPLEVAFIPYNDLEDKLKQMDICISVVVPNESTRITSPIKISDYIMLNKIIIANKGIGDFDSFFINNNSAIIYNYKQELNFNTNDLAAVNIKENKELKKYFEINTNKKIILNKIKKILV